MILQYGNLTILSIQDLSDGMFPDDHPDHTHRGSPRDRSSRARGGGATREGGGAKGIMVFAEEQWQEHNSASRVFGIDIQAPDIYPILKFPEVRMRYKKVNPGGGRQSRRGQRSTGEGSASSGGSNVEIHVHEPVLPTADKEGSCDNHLTNRMVSIDQIDTEFEKLKNRLDINRSGSSSILGKGGVGGGVPDQPWDTTSSSGRSSPALRGRGCGAGGGNHHVRNWYVLCYVHGELFTSCPHFLFHFLCVQAADWAGCPGFLQTHPPTSCPQHRPRLAVQSEAAVPPTSP